jgi:2-phospho-L-lactate guanylyltransferase
VSKGSNDVAYLVLQGDPATSKTRLRDVLSQDQRQRLTRYCLERVKQAVGTSDLYMLAENHAAAAEGTLLGIPALLQQGSELNEALTQAVTSTALGRYRAIAIIPNDLPFLTSLTTYETRPSPQCLITPDAHLSGTNLLRVPTSMQAPRFAFGDNSFFSHLELAATAGLAIEVHPSSGAFDIDTANDLVLARETFPHAELWSIL